GLRGWHAPEGASRIWWLALVMGVCHVAGLALTYRAFEIGTVSLVAPIASGFAVVTAVLELATGEHPNPTALLGAALLCGGVVLATRTHSEAEAKSLVGVPEALGSALAFGVMFWLFDYVQGYAYTDVFVGYIWPLILLKIM